MQLERLLNCLLVRTVYQVVAECGTISHAIRHPDAIVPREKLMRAMPQVRAWVVYETVAGTHVGMRCVCTEQEWKDIEARELSRNRIVKGGIVDENEAEKLARGTSGDAHSARSARRGTR